MAIAVTLRGFNDLGRSMTPVFLSMAHFLYRLFYVLRKNEENALRQTLFAKRSSFSCAAVSNASLSVKVCKSGGNI